MMGRCGVNKSACILITLVFVVLFLLINNIIYTISSTSHLNAKVSDDLSYGVIIDAGSTGSRLFLYSWKSKSDKELIDIKPVTDFLNQPVVRKVSPGLSTFSEKPEEAADYIKPLLDYAAQFVRSEKQSATPVFIFATAGMRLLTITKQNAIMKNLHEKLPKLTNFQILPSHVQVISGKWEGIYSWIAVNYMLNRFTINTSDNSNTNTNTNSKQNRPLTAGMIDMGGASAQIAFELPMENNFSNENVQLVNLGCRDDDKRFLYKLFVTTFLGYGANEGSKKYEDLLMQRLQGLYEKSEKSNSSTTQTLRSNEPEIKYMRDGCLPRNFLKLVTKDNGQQFVRKGTGNWDKCVSDLENLLFNGPNVPTCPTNEKCFFGGVVAPSVSLSEVELYGFSEYWFSVEDVLSLGGEYNHDIFEQKAKGFCGKPWSDIKKDSLANVYPKADEERLQTQCFKSAWIHAVLHNGFYVDEQRHHFKSTFKINGEEVQWALGAMIYQMRYFPLITTNQDIGSISKLHEHLHNSSTGWTLFYLLLIFILLFMLYINFSQRYYANRAALMKKTSSPSSEFPSAKVLFRNF